MGHMNLKNNTQNAPYHTILRWKIHKFSGKGHSPSKDPTSSLPTVKIEYVGF